MAWKLMILGLFMSLSATIAYAEIGPVGPNVEPIPPRPTKQAPVKAVTPATVTTQPATTAQDADTQLPEEPKPQMAIDFKQKRVYFDRALSQSVDEKEKANPNTVYDIKSYVPDTDGDRIRSKQAREEAEENLRSVQESLRAQGIPESRIRVTTQPYPKATEGQQNPDYNKIEIYAQ